MRLKPSLEQALRVMTEYNAREWLREQLEDERRQAARDRKTEALLGRAIAQIADPGGLRGAEREFAAEMAGQRGTPFDPHRLNLPFAALESRTLTAAGSGGNLIGEDVLEVRDLLAPFSAVARAGVNIAPGLQFDTPAPHTDSDIALTWQASETSAVTPATPTIASTTMTPHSAIAVVQASKQLLRQSPLAEPWIRRALLRAAGSAIDQAVLNGAGSGGEVEGIVNNGGISTETGTSIAWSNLLSMKANAADINAADESITFIGTVAVRQLLEARERGTNGDGFIWESGTIASCPAHACTLMPTGTLLSGPFSEITLGMWGPGIELSANPFSNFQAGLVAIRIELRIDIALTCAATAFTKSTSIT